MLRVLVALVALASAAAPAPVNGRQDAAPRLWGGLTPGPYRVGYRKLGQRDQVVHIWYPAAATARPLRFRDYLDNKLQDLASFLAQTGAHGATIDSLFASVLYAVAAPRPIDRSFPLVLIAQGNGEDVADQVVLCEYLASRGFVVAATPSPMLRVPLEREDQVGELAEMQTSDLRAAITAVAAVVRVDSQHVGVVGHSFGARAAVLLAMRDPRIRAIVSLDGGIGTSTAVEPFTRAPSFRANAPLPPLLHFYETEDAFMKPDFGLLKSLRVADLTLVHVEAMHHVHFTTYGFEAALFPEIAAPTHATAGTASALAGVIVRTVDFLHQWLGDADNHGKSLPPRFAGTAGLP